MTVYVDDMRAPFGRMIMCHMWSEDENALHEMARKIGIVRKWFPKAEYAHRHYDIALSKKKLAIQFGAVEITQRDLALKIREYRESSGL